MSVSAYDHDHSYMAPPHPSTQAAAPAVQRPVQTQRVVHASVKAGTFVRSPVVQARPIVGQVWRTTQSPSQVHVNQSPGITVYTVGGQQQELAQQYTYASVTTLPNQTSGDFSGTSEYVSYDNCSSSLNLAVPIREPSPEPVVEEPPAPDAQEDPSTSEAVEDNYDEDDGEIDIQV
ncbi:hypothetical protein ANCCAN_15079 [Ancylostoma caninum]|uniref:Uncharacterized protein n=1 Tax=Ancylostoma caninum TaxID=29170 RepID=A0A368G3I5_ANCCA|nr:hypothetical protein ANCCAN_15079 [Ancylostoma caninum]